MRKWLSGYGSRQTMMGHCRWHKSQMGMTSFAAGSDKLLVDGKVFLSTCIPLEVNRVVVVFLALAPPWTLNAFPSPFGYLKLNENKFILKNLCLVCLSCKVSRAQKILPASKMLLHTSIETLLSRFTDCGVEEEHNQLSQWCLQSEEPLDLSLMKGIKS